MSEKKTIRAGAVCLLVSLLAALFFTACVSKAVNAADKIELGQKYLTELYGSCGILYRSHQAGSGQHSGVHGPCGSLHGLGRV